MKFDAIGIAAAQADLPDPRTNPALVPFTAVKTTPDTLRNTDSQPTLVVLTLEGTAAQNVDLERYVVEEPDGNILDTDRPTSSMGDRRFYKIPGGPLTITVGEITLAPSYPGQIYYRLTGAPAAAATLRIGYKAGEQLVVGP